jgi:hypothetical protein
LYRLRKARLAGVGKLLFHATSNRCTAKVQIHVAFRQAVVNEEGEAACG